MLGGPFNTAWIKEKLLHLPKATCNLFRDCAHIPAVSPPDFLAWLPQLSIFIYSEPPNCIGSMESTCPPITPSSYYIKGNIPVNLPRVIRLLFGLLPSEGEVGEVFQKGQFLQKMHFSLLYVKKLT
nr:PREDICTED: uncharacterized protein LOC106707100 [Latimeria chalumnae]|eukprot:XP_014354415.1 PREDICTED: uncharacterized protein LOC106707100 [Latimeria chalumnae]